ncbi:ATP-binding cassette sub-family A member 1-like protein [Dinothrombium tinctorium]|uniref:ATP-binding cassette sub-family A member 1-like protein n=1 Tax=Dinothrombium tinctorium TaxID=1965070 RepID=A0A3S4RHJ4_9ACAR|nr:ATP-binding cassette sub-family A member 1-like protein [Dinothrombium tinctorium]RWS16240.1 ATP-binding cassette sub-family A member 1-like protein [Dinothrombium tinctorium]
MKYLNSIFLVIGFLEYLEFIHLKPLNNNQRNFWPRSRKEATVGNQNDNLMANFANLCRCRFCIRRLCRRGGKTTVVTGLISTTNLARSQTKAEFSTTLLFTKGEVEERTSTTVFSSTEKVSDDTINDGFSTVQIEVLIAMGINPVSRYKNYSTTEDVFKSQTEDNLCFETNEIVAYYYPSNDLTERLMNKSICIKETKLRVAAKPLKWNIKDENIIIRNTNEKDIIIVFRDRKTRKPLENSDSAADGLLIELRPLLYNVNEEQIYQTEPLASVSALYSFYETFEKQIFTIAFNSSSNIKYVYEDASMLNIYFLLIQATKIFLTIPVTICFMRCLYIIVKRIVDERNSKVRELMRMSGVRNFDYLASLFLFNFAILSLYSIPMILILSSLIGKLLLTAAFIPFIASSIFFSMSLTTICSNRQVTTSLFLILWLVLPYIVDWKIKIPTSSAVTEFFYLLLCVIIPPNHLFNLFIKFSKQNIFLTGLSLHFLEMFKVEPMYQILCPAAFLITLIISCFFWLLFLWYVGEVWPWQDGITKPFHFPISQFFALKRAQFECEKSKENEYFEKEPENLKCAIKVINVRKRFGTGDEVLKGVNLNVYRGQITILLGHNGAGKTTLMNLMTGVLQANSGQVLLNGFDIEKNPALARKNLGLCPQTNILFEKLTVEEHFYFFGLLKGFNLNSIQIEVFRILMLLGLFEKRSNFPNEISGGMKRKLQLGIAFIGGSDTLILDEPTSGMDVETRRVIWDLLLSKRRDYLILITTHHMEEAEYLGERIAIMSQGKVRCCGSPMFLKNSFKIGYHIRIAKADNFNQLAVESLFKKHLNSFTLEKISENEVLYHCSKSESSKLASLFEEFDHVKANIGVQAIGISATTIDDVFLKAGAVFEPEKLAPLFSFMHKPSKTQNSCTKAFLIKRYHNIRRKKATIAFFIFWTAFISCLMHSLGHELFIYSEWSKDLNFKAIKYSKELEVLSGICAGDFDKFCEQLKKIGYSYGVQFEHNKTARLRDLTDILITQKKQIAIFASIYEESKVHILAPSEGIYFPFIINNLISNTLQAIGSNQSDYKALITFNIRPFKNINATWYPAENGLFIVLMYAFTTVWPLVYLATERKSNVSSASI